jgi:hypothetical protein
MKNNAPFVAALLALTLLAACDRQTAPAAVAPARAPAATGASSAPAPAAATDKWAGQWTGPEGTFLKIAGSGGKYEITIQNLDGPRSFEGKAAGETIEFERNGTKETLRATNGAATGMKWLADKTDCLTVRAGEGYCRG